MDLEQFQEMIGRLIEKQQTLRVGSQEYNDVTETLLEVQKAYQAYQEDITEQWKIDLERNRIESEERMSSEKNEAINKQTNRQFIANMVYVGGLITLGAFCTVWSVNNPMINKMAQSLMGFLKPRI